MSAPLRFALHPIVTALLATTVFLGCPQPIPLPLAGWAEFIEVLFVDVPGGRVNVGGGNYFTSRVDLSIDTRVTTYNLGAVYNSASGAWHWGHEMTYSGTTFVDETGGSTNLTNVSLGSAVPGTHWVRLDADSMKTKGGLVYDFSATGKLAAIHWLGFDYPRLRFTTQTIASSEHITAIDQCTSATACINFFTLAYNATTAKLETATDRASRTASFAWDGSGRLATAKDGLDNAKGWDGFRYEYSGTNLTAITNSEGERIEYTYDASARLLTAKRIGDNNPTWTISYFTAPAGGYYSTNVTNSLSQVTKYRFDGFRRLFELENAAVAETTLFQWFGNRISQVRLPDGVQTNFSIVDDDVTQMNEASGNAKYISYAPNAIDPDRPKARPVDVIADSIGLVEDRNYDGQGRLTSVLNGEGDTTSYTWQSNSPTARATSTAPTGVVTTFGTQGDHGHPSGAQTGNQLTTGFTYDSVGNLLNGQDASSEVSPGMGGVVSRTFDADRNVATVVLKNMLPTAHNETLTLENRSDRRVDAIRPPTGGDTEFGYSATGRVVARHEKANGAWVTTSFDHDALDRVISTELANGMRSERVYDGAGRTTSIVSKRSGVTEETLTRAFASGRKTSSNDTAYTGAETYSYDSAGRIATITFPGGERQELVYDLRSRITTKRFIDENDWVVLELQYTHDLANRVTEIHRHALGVLILMARYVYTDGFVTEKKHQNNQRRTATVDANFGLPRTTVATNAQSQVVEDSLNELGSVLTSKYSAIAGTSLPDEWYGFTSEWRVVVDPGSGFVNQSKWDAVSNLRETNGRRLVYNAEANRLTRIEDIAQPTTIYHNYTYDAAGFVTSRDGVVLGYDATGAIASIGSVAAFDHDLDGRIVSRTLNGVTKIFRFGGAIAYDTSWFPIEMDHDDFVLSFGSGSASRFRHADFRGNVMFVTKPNGSVDGWVSYRAFGRMSVTGNVGERGFAGGFEVPSLGLVVLGPRVLDSDAGRFLSQDPVFNKVNQYAYAQGNPVFFWDPTGHHPTGGLDGLNGLGGFGIDLGSIGGAAASNGSGSGVGNSGPPAGIEEVVVTGKPTNEEQEMLEMLAVALVIANGVEMIAIGFEVVAGGVALAVPTGGTSLLASAGGLVIVGAGTITVGAGMAMAIDAGAGAGN